MTSPPGGQRAKAPQSLSSLLGDVARVAAQAAGQAMSPGEWAAIVGKRIAQRTRPGKLEGGQLTVQVASSVWAQELSLLSKDLVHRLRQAGLSVKELRFRVVSDLPAATRPQPARRAAPPPALPASLAPHVARIEDPELRELVAFTAASSLARSPAGQRPTREATAATSPSAALVQPAALTTQTAARTTSPPPDARGPRSAAARSVPPAPTSPTTPSAPPRTSAKRRG